MLHRLDLQAQVQEERYRDWRRAAAQQGLVNQARAARPSPRPLYGRVLAAFSGRLVAWGRTLQVRHAALVEAPRAAEPGPYASQC